MEERSRSNRSPFLSQWDKERIEGIVTPEWPLWRVSFPLVAIERHSKPFLTNRRLSGNSILQVEIRVAYRRFIAARLFLSLLCYDI